MSEEIVIVREMREIFENKFGKSRESESFSLNFNKFGQKRLDSLAKFGRKRLEGGLKYSV